MKYCVLVNNNVTTFEFKDQTPNAMAILANYGITPITPPKLFETISSYKNIMPFCYEEPETFSNANQGVEKINFHLEGPFDKLDELLSFCLRG